MHALHASLLESDLSIRFGLFLLAHVFLYLWTRYVVAPAKVGAARLLCSAPLIPVLLFLTLLFHVDRAAEFVPVCYCTHNFLWLTATKLWAFCLNRGQLVRSYESRSNTAFALSLLCPITVDFNAAKAEHKTSDKHAYEDARFSIPQYTAKEVMQETLQTAARLVGKAVLIVGMNWGYQRCVESGYPFWRDVCLGWIFYAATALVEDLAAVCILITLNIKPATSFDCPWMAQSVTELWSRRYNLVFGQTLRDLAYDPICEGSWVHGPKYFDKKRPSSLRRLIAVLVTFGASGAIHVIAMQHSIQTDLMVHYGLFFVINGCIVALENAIKSLLKQSGYRSVVLSAVPRWVYHLYAIGVIFCLNHWFFWPDLHAIGAGDMIANGVMSFLRNLNILI